MQPFTFITEALHFLAIQNHYVKYATSCERMACRDSPQSPLSSVNDTTTKDIPIHNIEQELESGSIHLRNWII